MKVLRPSKNKLTGDYNTSHRAYDFDDVPIKDYYASFEGTVRRVVKTWDRSWIANTPSDPWYPGPGKPQRPLRTDDYGNFLILVSDDGITQLAAHFPKNGIVVQLGDRVKRGQIVGYAPGTDNDTGNSTGGHTHTEYRLSSGTNTWVEFETDYPIVKPPEPPSMNYEELGHQFEVLLRRYGKGSFNDFDTFLKEHLGEDGQGGFLASERSERKRLEQKVKELTDQLNQPQPPIGNGDGTLPTTWNGKEVLGVLIKP